jgi:hypothetical protein
VQRLPHHRVMPPDTHHAEPGEHVEVVVAVGVEQQGALCPFVDLVEADGAQHPRLLVVEMACVQLVPLGSALRQQLLEVEVAHPPAPFSVPVWSSWCTARHCGAVCCGRSATCDPQRP